METSDITVEILKDIRSGIERTNQRLDQTRTELRSELAQTRQELKTELAETRHDLGDRMSHIETAVLDLAEQQRFVVRYTKALAERDGRLDSRVDSLEGRVSVLESKNPR